MTSTSTAHASRQPSETVAALNPPTHTTHCLLPALSTATQLEVESLKQRLVAADMALTTVQASHTQAVGQAATAQVCAHT